MLVNHYSMFAILNFLSQNRLHALGRLLFQIMCHNNSTLKTACYIRNLRSVVVFDKKYLPNMKTGSNWPNMVNFLQIRKQANRKLRCLSNDRSISLQVSRYLFFTVAWLFGLIQLNWLDIQIDQTPTLDHHRHNSSVLVRSGNFLWMGLLPLYAMALGDQMETGYYRSALFLCQILCRSADGVFMGPTNGWWHCSGSRPFGLLSSMLAQLEGLSKSILKSGS